MCFMRNKIYNALWFSIALLGGCNQPVGSIKNTRTDSTVITEVKPVETTYRILRDKDSIKRLVTEYGAQLNILLAVNRTDTEHIVKMDSVLIPALLTGTVNQYSPFPQSIPYTNIKKVIYFSYHEEYFAAYQEGKLVRSGPTNMGREKDPTPTGLFFTNWKGEEVKSTSNDEWILKWNFNIVNDSGIGFHQYALPGYPASHSCLRLEMDDAMFLYTFADEWKTKGKEMVLAQGTPVIVFGAYPFGRPKPWFQLASNPHALDISEATIKQYTDTCVSSIIMNQGKRERLQ